MGEWVGEGGKRKQQVNMYTAPIITPQGKTNIMKELGTQQNK